MESLWPRFFYWIIAHRRWVLGAAVLLLVTAGFLAKDLRIIVDTEKLLPESNPYVHGSHEITKVFGLKYALVVGVRNNQGIIDNALLHKVDNLTRALQQTPYAIPGNIVSLTARKAKAIHGSAEGLEITRLAGPTTSASDVIKSVEDTPIFQRILLSEDKSTAFIIAEYRKPENGYREIMKAVAPILAQQRDDATEIYSGGFVRLMAETENYSDRVGLLLVGSILIIGILLFSAFRARQAMIVPIMTGLLTVILLLGVMGLTGVPLDVFNAITPILILAVVAGHSVQLLKRYYEEFETLSISMPPEKASHDAIVISLSKMAPVTISAGIAASIGFFSLIVFQIETIWIFGVMAGTAILIGLALELIFIPALRASLKPPEPGRVYEGRLMAWLKRLCAHFSDVIINRSGLIFGIALLTVLVAMLGSYQIKVDNSNKRNYSADTPVSRDDAVLNAQFAGTNTLYIMIDGKNADAVKIPEFMSALDAVGQELAKEPDVGKTVSMADHVKRLNQALNEGDPSLFRVPESQALISELLFLYSLSGDPDDFNTFVDSDYRRASIAVFLKTDSSSRAAELIAKATRTIQTRLGDNVAIEFGGSLPEAIAINEAMVHDKLLNMAQVIAVVWLVTALMFRSAFAGLLVVTPVLMSILVNFGLMGWLGIPLSIPTAACAGMVVGIGADYGIYILYRWREFLRAGMGYDDALRATMGSAGAACLVVAMSIGAGYSVLIFSQGFNPHRWIGILVVSAMVVSSVTAITLTPALLRKFRPRFIEE